jgi:dolichol kinase
MVNLIFGDIPLMDFIMAVLTGFIASAILALAYWMTAKGVENWKARKFVHISLSTIIALTLFAYTNLTGPAFAIGIFLTVLFYAWAHKSELISVLLHAGSREGESKLSTFASALMGMIAFGIVFFMFLSHAEITVASILTVSWGDAAGEVIGRPYGGRFVKKKFGTKSIEGFTSVFIFSSMAIITAILTHAPLISILATFPLILIMGLAIALIELFSRGWLDNFLIPLFTAVLMWLLFYPGVPLIS